MNALFAVAVCLISGLDSLNCRLLGGWPYGPARMYKETVSDSLTYVSVGAGMYLLNVTRPDSIEKVGELPNGVAYLSRSGNLLCATEFRLGRVALFDISDLRRPLFLGRYDTPGLVGDVHFDGRYAYVACGDSNMRVLDFNEPASPRLVGICALPAEGLEIAVQNDIAVVTTGFAGVSIIDVSEVTRPVLRGQYARARDQTIHIRMADTVVYATFDNGGLIVLGVSDPAHPNELSRYSSPAGAGCLAIRDTIVLVETFGWPRSVKAISVADPRTPRLLGSFRTPRGDCSFLGLAVSGSRAYTVWSWRSRDSLLILDISDPTSMSRLGGFGRFPSATDDVQPAGSLLLTGTRGTGLLFFDVSDPGNPECISQVLDTVQVSRVHVRGSIAYLACTNGPVLRIVDFTDPYHPRQTGMLDVHGWGNAVACQGEYVYLAEEDRLRIVDVSEPSRPTQTAILSLSSGAFGVAVEDSFCYVANWYGGIRVVDVSDPASPVEIAHYATPCSAAVDLHLHPPYLFYADIGGFGILDVSDPRTPIPLTFVWTQPRAENWGLDYDGGLLAVACAFAGIRLYDLSDPRQPVLVGFYDALNWSYHVRQVGNLTYVADYRGFAVVEYVGSGITDGGRPGHQTSPELSVVYDPVTKSIRLDLSRHDSAVISIVDVSGRVHITRCMASSAPGDGMVVIDVSGLPSGAYLVRVTTERHVATGRFVLVR